MHPSWHLVPWLTACANSGTLILWKWNERSIEWFYGYSLVFYSLTTFFSVCVCAYTLVFYRTFWAEPNSIHADTVPATVKATLRLMVRFIVADITCNLGYVPLPS
jgi:hypothetical protein